MMYAVYKPAVSLTGFLDDLVPFAGIEAPTVLGAFKVAKAAGLPMPVIGVFDPARKLPQLRVPK